MLNQMPLYPRQLATEEPVKMAHLTQMRITMSTPTATKATNILRDRWRHNRKLIETVKHPRVESSVPLEQDRRGEIPKEFERQKSPQPLPPAKR